MGRISDMGGLRGYFGYGGFTGTIAAGLANNSELFQFRWASLSNLALIQRVTISGAMLTTAFATASMMQFALIKATAWTVNGTGGTAIAPAALLKKRTSFLSSEIGDATTPGDIRIATTAALTAGTKTLETLALHTVIGLAPTTGTVVMIAPNTVLYDAKSGESDDPIILATNEGFVITTPLVAATGTWVMGVTVDWAEVTEY